MPRTLKSAEQIAAGVNVIIRSDRDVIADGSHAQVGLPQRLAEDDHTGCNWTIEHVRNAAGHEGLVRAAIETVRGEWNLRPDFDLRHGDRNINYGSASPQFKRTINPGDVITLRILEVDTKIRLVEVIGNGKLAGEILSFPGKAYTELLGCLVGDRVEFWPQQIFYVGTT
jgi:hypothetical protein